MKTCKLCQVNFAWTWPQRLANVMHFRSRTRPSKA